MLPIETMYDLNAIITPYVVADVDAIKAKSETGTGSNKYD